MSSTFRQLLVSVLPTRLLGAIRHYRSHEWQRANAADDEAVRAMIRLSVGSRGILVDVGAHRGDILQAAVEVAPEAGHVAFEPGPMFDEVVSRFPAAEVHRACVGAESGDVEFFVYERSTRSSKSSIPGEALRSRLVVKQVTLDDVIASNRIVSVVKIDVEGHELGVLRGASRLLAEQQPTIIFEHGSPDGGVHADSASIFDLLTRGGYRIFGVRGEALPNYSAFAEVLESGRIWNFVAFAVAKQ